MTSLRWWDITLTNNLVSFCNKILSDAKVKLQVRYSKIVANRGKYNRTALSQIYSCFCDHSVLYLSGLYSVLKRKDLKALKSSYSRFLRFLFYLPPWYKNSDMVTNFGAPNLLNKLKVLHQKLSDSIHFTINPFHGLLKCFPQ